MEEIRQQFKQAVSIIHYGDAIYLVDDGEPLGELMPLVEGREIMTDKIVFLLCRNGYLRLRLNYHELTLSAGCILIALPGMIIDTQEVCADFRAATMLLSERFTDSLNLGNSYRTLLSIYRQPMVQLDEEMTAAMLNFIGMVRGLLRVPSHPNMDRVLHLLFEAWFFGFGPYLHSTGSQRVATSAEQHTEEFLRLVEQHFHQHHALDWYAQQLNITPKRLSICVKETSGRTPLRVDLPPPPLSGQQSVARAKALRQGSGRALGFSQPVRFRHLVQATYRPQPPQRIAFALPSPGSNQVPIICPSFIPFLREK